MLHIRLGPLLGSGEFGKVYALDANNDAVVKIASDAEREIEIMKAVDHPHVIKLLCHLTARNKTCLFLPKYDTDLYAFLAENKHLPLRVRIDLLRQMFCGLTALHDAHVIHRDLKTDNLFLDKARMHLVVADFGLAAVSKLRDKRRLTSLVYAECYRAPEVETGYYTQAADMFAAGCLVFEVVTGKEPLFGDIADQAAIKKGRGVLPRHGVEAMEEALGRDDTAFWKRSFSKNPKSRPTAHVFRARFTNHGG